MNAKENKIVKDLYTTIRQADKKGTQAYDTPATVTRIEGETAWVHIPGGVDETPVRRTIDAKKGDSVQVRVSGGSAWLVGNASAPPTDDTTAKVAKGAAESAYKYAAIASEKAEDAIYDAGRARAAANRAEQSASDAQDSADEALASAHNANEYAARALGNLSTVQSVVETLNWITAHGTMTLTTDTALDPTHVYFVRDNNGDYEVGSYRYSVITEPNVDDIGTYYELSIDESLNNYVGTHLAVTGEGLWLIPETLNGNRVLIATGSGTTYTSAGTYVIGSSGEVLAKFSANGAQIGALNTGNVQIQPSGIDFYGGDGTANLAHIGYANGTAQTGTATAPYYSFGTRASGSTIGNYSLLHGKDRSLNSVVHNIIASGYCSYSGGSGTQATGDSSHAEGSFSVASGDNSHAEGFGTKAELSSSHAEGYQTTASGGLGSHAEGYQTTASGQISHAQGEKTIAQGYAQTAIGIFNKAQGTPTSKVMADYAFIIGNGSSDSARSNAFAVAWDGTIYVNNAVMPYVVETGTHNLWEYVKWSDGRIELWGKFTQTVTSYATNAWIIGHASLTNYPSGITNPIAVATCQKIGTGGGVICYDYERTDYWSGIANNFNGTIAQGESRAISWYVYVNARWQ